MKMGRKARDSRQGSSLRWPAQLILTRAWLGCSAQTVPLGPTRQRRLDALSWA